MKLKNQVRIETTPETAKYVLDVLLEHQVGYSSEHTPERIVKIREFIENLQKTV